jgi:hypothetical protein
MIEFIIGDYELQDDEIILKDFTHSLVAKTEANKSKKFVLFAEDVSLSKKDMEFIKENANINLKIVSLSRDIVKNFRSSKNFKIVENKCDNASINPFNLAVDIFKCADRDYLFNFLKTNKVNLFIPIKAISCNLNMLCEENKKIIQFVDFYLWRVNPELMYAMLAYQIKPDPYIKYFHWKYPKKQEKES